MKRALFFLPLTLTAACLPQLEPVEGVLYGQYQCDEDTFEQGDNPHAFGYIEVPYTICGELSTVSYVDNQYTGDIDYLTFQLSSTGPYTVELEWDKELSDFDLFLFIVRSNSNIAEVGSSAATDYPEYGPTFFCPWQPLRRPRQPLGPHDQEPLSALRDLRRT